MELLADFPSPLDDGQPVSVVVRPESLSFTDGPGLDGTVTECRYTGARAFFSVMLGDASVEVEASVDSANVGDTVCLTAERVRCYPEGV